MFNNIDALRQELSWTHYRLIIKLDDEKKRNFYIDKSIKANWGTSRGHVEYMDRYFLENNIKSCAVYSGF